MLDISIIKHKCAATDENILNRLNKYCKAAIPSVIITSKSIHDRMMDKYVVNEAVAIAGATKTEPETC